MQKAQRLLDLAAFLLRAAEPVSWREIQEQFADDYGGTGEAAIRKFERDKADLLELAIPIRYEPGDEDLAAGYQINRDEFYLPDLKLPPEDLALLYLAGSAALASGAFPYSRDLAHAMNKLSFAARAPGASEAAALATHHLSRPDAAGTGTSLLEELSRAGFGTHAALTAFGGRPPAVVHSFSGPLDYARDCVAMGLAISFSGLVFRPGEDASADVAAMVPPGRLLVETDSPYLSAPGAPRKRNEPAWVRLTAAWTAQQRGVSGDDLGDILVASYEAIFGSR